MAFVDGDPRLFINLAQTNKIAVVDRTNLKVLNTWPVPPAQQNAMVAFDPQQHRLYVVCRTPGMVVRHELRHRCRSHDAASTLARR